MRFIIKFGGSSLSNPNKIKKVASFIADLKQNKNLQLVAVVSAMGKTTSTLQNLVNSVSENPNQHTLASILSKGEEISANLLSIALNSLNIKNQVLTAKDILIHVSGHPNNAIITSIDTKNIENLLSAGNIVVIPGFQGVDEAGRICTLGRGGSDTTATALGSVLDAQVKIYTDVPGFYKFDPNLFDKNSKLDRIDTLSAIELSSCGAKVMEQRSLEIAYTNNLPLKVCKSETNDGTSINTSQISGFLIDGISFKNNICIVKKCKNKNNSLQNYIKNNGKMILYYAVEQNQNKLFEKIISDMSESELQKLKIKNIVSIDSCELITISGCGFLTNTNFMSFIENLILHNKKSIFFSNLTPTTIKIATKPRKAYEITKSLNNFCKMENII